MDKTILFNGFKVTHEMMEASKFIQFQHTSRIGMVWEELYQDYKGAPYEQTGALGAWRIKFKKKAYESA